MGDLQFVRLQDGVMAGRFRAMASPCEVLVEGATRLQIKTLTRVAAEEAWRIEAKWSRYRKGNLVDRINSASGAAVQLDDETARLIDFGTQLFAVSEGRFDLTSGVLRRAWRFQGGSRVPDDAEVRELLGRVGWQKVAWAFPWLRLEPGMEVDFGGLGKEYAVDRALALLSARTDRPVLINFGGDLAASSPRDGGTPWLVGIDSGVAGRATPLVRLARGGLATSGDANRCIEVNGVRFSHILDARTGWPPKDAPRSVTAAATSCVEAGALATLAILHGAQAEEWLEKQGVDASVQRERGDSSALDVGTSGCNARRAA